MKDTEVLTRYPWDPLKAFKLLLKFSCLKLGNFKAVSKLNEEVEEIECCVTFHLGNSCLVYMHRMSFANVTRDS